MKVSLEALSDQVSIRSATRANTVGVNPAADIEHENAVADLRRTQLALAEVGQLGDFLQQSKDLNASGATFANVAFESILEPVGMAQIQVVNANAVAGNHQEELNKSAEIIRAVKSELVARLQRNVAVISEHMARQELALHRGVTECMQRLQKLREQATAPETSMINTNELGSLWQGAEQLFYVGKGDYPKFEPGARTVCADLLSGIRLHQAAFDNLIEPYSAWIGQHADNVLKYDDGMNELTFDSAKAFGLASVDVVEDANGTRTARFMSPDLPGMVVFDYTCRHGRMVGSEVPAALGSVTFDITQYPWGASSTQLSNLNGLAIGEEANAVGVRRLTRDQAAARLAEAEYVLNELKRWDNHTRLALNSDHFVQIYKLMVGAGAESLQSRFAAELGANLLHVIDRSRMKLPSYVLNVIQNLLTYVEMSLSKVEVEQPK